MTSPRGLPKRSSAPARASGPCERPTLPDQKGGAPVPVDLAIEKGMGLIVPAFIPSPLGEMVEYQPTLNEALVCFGIWAFGLLLYTIFVRISVPVLTGQLTLNDNVTPRTITAGAIAK